MKINVKLPSCCHVIFYYAFFVNGHHLSFIISTVI